MKFWQVVSWCETEQLVAVAQHAEALGFEGIILAEHIYYPPSSESRYHYSEDGQSIQSDAMEFADPLISFAAIASVTKKLKMLTGIYILPLRHPVEAAKNMATLARLSDNRFMLGMGAGWLREEFEQMGVDFDSRGSRLDEMLVIQRQLWTGERVSFSGRHFKLENLRIKPYPSEPIPVLAGGTSKPALRRALGCEGWYGPGNTLEELQQIVPGLKQSLAEAGRDVSTYEIIAPLNEPLARDTIAQMQALGVTGTVAYPYLFGIGPDSTLAQKKAYMDAFAAEFISDAQ